MSACRIFVLLGQGGAVTSEGMLSLVRQLKALGNTTVTTHRWNAVQEVADEIRRWQTSTRKMKMVMIGYSLGANSTTLIAAALQREKCEIELVVAYDASRAWTSKIAPIGVNVRRAICYWNPTAWVFGGARLEGLNVGVVRIDMFHLAVDNSESLHAMTIAAVKKILKED